MSFKPHFTITNQIASALVKIERVRGFLEAARISESWISKMQARALILEAHYTTHIEGTQLSLDQSKKLLSGQKVLGASPEDTRELLNYRKAFDFVSEYIVAGGVISEGVVREIHKLLVEGVRGNQALPGQYRNIQNYVVNSNTKEVIYTPPPSFEVPLMMVDLINWIQHNKELPIVIIAGIAQFQLVHIHPFLDGNGRSARLLSTLCLYQNGYDFKKLFTISEYYDRNRTDYYKAIQSVRDNDMDLTNWLEYFTLGLATQMREIQEKGEQAIRLDVISLEYSLTERQKSILEYIFTKEKSTIQELSLQFSEINVRTIQRELQKLVEFKLLRTEGSARHTTYFAVND